MSTSRQDIEIKRAHAVLTKERLQKRTEERMSLPIKSLIEYCEDTIVICNAILSWPQCPAKGMFGRDFSKLEKCQEECSIISLCRQTHNLMNIDEVKSEKKKPYTPKCFGKFTKHVSCERCPFIEECKETKKAK